MKLNKFSEFLQGTIQEWPKIVYGNPQKYQKEKMEMGSDALMRAQRSGLMNSWLEELVPPDQHQIREEFNKLIKASENLSDEDRKFIKEAEEDHMKIFYNFLKENGKEDTYDQVYAITFEMDPIVFILKYHWNYPRPLQLAYYYGVPLYPEQPSNSSSPAYPSGHAIDSYTIALMYGKKYPELKEELLKLADRITHTRQQGGVHYFFDAEAGKKIAQDAVALEIIKL
jgi:hypothetical protein